MKSFHTTPPLIVFLFALCVSLTAIFLSAQTTPESAQTFQPPKIKDMFESHKGVPITEIGISAKDASHVLSMIMTVDIQDFGITSVSQLKKELLVRNVDMGEGISNGLVVQGANRFCGGNGNCAAWFLRKVNSTWKPLFPLQPIDHTIWVAAFGFVLPKHNGLYDLVTLGKGSNAEYPTDLWRFNGAHYVMKKQYCWYQEPGHEKIEEGDCH